MQTENPNPSPKPFFLYSVALASEMLVKVKKGELFTSRVLSPQLFQALHSQVHHIFCFQTSDSRLFNLIYESANKLFQSILFSPLDRSHVTAAGFKQPLVLSVHRKGPFWLDVVYHLNQIVFVHMPGSMHLMEPHLEVVDPIVQNAVLNVFLAERFTHAVYEVTARFRLNVHQFRQLWKVQVHDEAFLVLPHILVGYDFIHEFSFPKIIVRFVKSSRLLTLIVNNNVIVLQRVWNSQMLITQKLS